jgi:hypothetical protein
MRRSSGLNQTTLSEVVILTQLQLAVNDLPSSRRTSSDCRSAGSISSTVQPISSTIMSPGFVNDSDVELIVETLLLVALATVDDAPTAGGADVSIPPVDCVTVKGTSSNNATMTPIRMMYLERIAFDQYEMGKESETQNLYLYCNSI